MRKALITVAAIASLFALASCGNKKVIVSSSCKIANDTISAAPLAAMHTVKGAHFIHGGCGVTVIDTFTASN